MAKEPIMMKKASSTSMEKRASRLASIIRLLPLERRNDAEKLSERQHEGEKHEIPWKEIRNQRLPEKEPQGWPSALQEKVGAWGDLENKAGRPAEHRPFFQSLIHLRRGEKCRAPCAPKRPFRADDNPRERGSPTRSIQGLAWRYN
ncbi:MAG: hypothetical protein IPH04_05550 [Saprospirales bacterium]|nr:hypothetical protein [Saprospirales bacterium]